MKEKVLNLTYASSLTGLCEANSSFDSGILRIAYPGVNRNGSSISKEVFEKCLKSAYNCPIVCNYDSETDTLGGHDMAVVHSDNGDLKLINLTTPVGVIPESSRLFWENVEEDDGTSHEYLCAEALIWKRQEAYQKIKKDGITAQSMEITVKDGKMVDKIYQIYDFEFTAFALIGCEPCFESASFIFSKQEFERQFSIMMRELKEGFSKVSTPNGDDINQKIMKGGREILDKNELIKKYGINVEELDFSIDDFTVDELIEKFEAMKKVPEGSKDDFTLMKNLIEEVRHALGTVMYKNKWGDEYPRYCFADIDTEANKVYCWDEADWLLYGFDYKLNGDKVEIDFESKKRKKYEIVDFDEGEQPSPFIEVYESLEKTIHDNADAAEKYQAASEKITSLENELEGLRQYKLDKEAAIAQAAVKTKCDNVFAQFPDLNDVEAFNDLKAQIENDLATDYSKVDSEILEEKCFAIRGRQGIHKNFSTNQGIPKLKVGKDGEEHTAEPYGGIFEEYGFLENN